jgi:hypothetical protein
MKRGPKDYRSQCGFNAICDVCGFKFKGDELRKRWDGLMVCSDDWEARHPQEFVKGKRDRQTPPYTRPQPDLVFVE